MRPEARLRCAREARDCTTCYARDCALAWRSPRATHDGGRTHERRTCINDGVVSRTERVSVRAHAPVPTARANVVTATVVFDRHLFGISYRDPIREELVDDDITLALEIVFTGSDARA